MPKEVKFPHNNVYTRLAPSKIHGVGVFAKRYSEREKYLCERH